MHNKKRWIISMSVLLGLAIFSFAQAVPNFTTGLNVSGGSVGIGTTAPSGKLHVIGMSEAFPAVSGTTQAGLITRLQSSTSNGILDIGYGGNGKVWLQSTSIIDLSQTFPLLLNPNGGNVGIGKTNPATALDVNGIVTATGFSGPLSGTLNAGNVSSGAFGSSTGGGNYSFPGSVGIGVASPAAKLMVSGQAVTGNGTVQTMLIDGAGGNGAITINSAAGGHAYQTLALGGVAKFEFGVNPGGDFYLNPNIQTGSAGSAIYIQKSTGSVGIGTTNPNVSGLVSRLTIKNDSSTSLGLIGASDARILAVNPETNNGVTFFNGAGGSWIPAMTLLNGSVGIGTTAPGANLHVAGSSFLLGNAGVFRFYEAEQLNYNGGTVNTDSTASNGQNWGSATSETTIYGPYGNIPIGNYRYIARMKVTDNTYTGNVSRLQAIGGGAVSTPDIRYIKGTDFGASNTWQEFSVPFRVTAATTNNLEFYAFSMNGRQIYVDYIMVIPDIDSGTSNIVGNQYVSGNVGIGVTNPEAKLHIYNSAANSEVLRLASGPSYTAGYGPIMVFQNGGGEQLAGIKGSFNESSQGNRGNLSFYTRTSDAAGIEEKVRILHNGNVGIGTTNPQRKLHITGLSDAGSNGIFQAAGDGRGGIVVRDAYPNIDIVSTMYSNGSHGATLGFVAYDNSSMDTWKRWVIGTPGGNATHLDFGYAPNNSNPHYGIANYPGDSSGFTVMSLNNSGNVGIGTTNPTNKLQVSGSLGIDRSVNYGGIWFNSGTDTNHVLWDAYYGTDPATRGAAGSGWDGIYWNTLNGIHIRTGLAGATERFIVDGPNNNIELLNSNVGIGTASPNTNLQAIGAGGVNLPSFEFRNSRNGTNNYVNTRFVNTYGNHSWGATAEFRTEGAADRPGVIFSSTNAGTSWGVGYLSGTDDNFRISQNYGYPGQSWGTPRLTIDTSGNATFSGIVTAGGFSGPVSYATSAGSATNATNAGYATTAGGAFGMSYDGNAISGAGPSTGWDSRPGVGNAAFAINWHTGVTISGYPGYGGVRLYASGYPTHASSVLRLEASSAVYTYGGLYSDGNAVIHAGNIGSQSVNYAASAGSASSAGNADTTDGQHLGTGNVVTFNRLTLRQSGVNLGTGNSAQLEINNAGSGAANISFHREGAYGAHFGLDTDNWFSTYGWSAGGGYTSMRVGALTAAGNVTAPAFYDSNNPGYYLNPDGTSNLNVVNAVTFQYSDITLKKNITLISNPLDKIMQLRGVTFNWKKDDTASIGVIAQEVEKVFPELVSESDGKKTVQYGNLVAPLIEAVKAQQEEIESLKAQQLKSSLSQQIQINSLRAQLQALEIKTK